MEQHDMEYGMNDDEYGYEYDEYSSNMNRKNAYLVPHDIPNYSFNFPSPSPLTSTFVNRSSSPPMISTHSYHTATQPHHSTSSSPQSLDEMVSSPPQALQAKTKKEIRKSSKKYKERWSKNETELLVSLWKESFDEIKSSKPREAWRNLLKKFSSLSAGPERSLTDLRNKLHNVVSSYRDAKKKNNKTGEEFHTSVCYDQVDSVLNCRDQLTLPEVKECGMDEDDDDGENEVNGISEDYMRTIREEKEKNVTKNGKEKAPRRVKDEDKVDRQL